jgi:hypothetical protein
MVLKATLGSLSHCGGSLMILNTAQGCLRKFAVPSTYKQGYSLFKEQGEQFCKHHACAHQWSASIGPHFSHSTYRLNFPYWRPSTLTRNCSRPALAWAGEGAGQYDQTRGSHFIFARDLRICPCVRHVRRSAPRKVYPPMQHVLS